MGLKSLQQDFLLRMRTEGLPQGLAPKHHFSVYQSAYRLRLRDSLKDDFPETLENISDATEILDAFIEAHPSRSWTLAEFAREFPRFIEKKSPELALSAKKEWARWIAFSIGVSEPEPYDLEETFALFINPSLQVVSEGETCYLIYDSRQGIKEHAIPRQWLPLIERSQALSPFQTIQSELNAPEAELVALVQEWSALGIILGFTRGRS